MGSRIYSGGSSGSDLSHSQMSVLSSLTSPTFKNLIYLRRAKSRLISTAAVFCFFLLPHLLAVFYSPIPDCDEVFNYWEASHYLNHGYGLQTWEYSPVYAIRSWAYAGLHSAVIAPFTLISTSLGGKYAEFYLMRIFLGLVCAICETRLYRVISNTLSSRIAVLFMLIMTTSTGMFHASDAYLPSSFAMYTAMLGTASFMNWTGGTKTEKGILWFGIGAVLGWPFAAALVLPFMAMELVLSFSSKSFFSLVQRSISGALKALVVLVRDLEYLVQSIHNSLLPEGPSNRC
jgi:glycosyl transferase family 22 (putative mannosyltransferase)